MFFANSEQRARSRAFEAYIAGTSEVLSSPTVQAALGARAVALQAINETVLLPNFDGTTIAISKRQRNSDRNCGCRRLA